MREKQIGTLGLAGLFLLRIAVGWHFFQEGASKLTNPDFSATPFLQEATGPFARPYHNMIADRYGKERLDRDAHITRWQQFAKSFCSTLHLDDDKKKEADALVEASSKTLKDYYNDRKGDWEELQADLARLESYDDDSKRKLPEFEMAWRKKRSKEMQTDLAGWYKDLRALDESLEQSMWALAPEGTKNFPKLPRIAEGKSWVENRVSWNNTIVGACLLLGLFVPIAGLMGAAFLLSVVVTQPFWVPGANLSFAYYQHVEIAALIALALTSAGRIAGLDYFLARWWRGLRDGAQSQAYT